MPLRRWRGQGPARAKSDCKQPSEHADTIFACVCANVMRPHHCLWLMHRATLLVPAIGSISNGPDSMSYKPGRAIPLCVSCAHTNAVVSGGTHRSDDDDDDDIPILLRRYLKERIVRADLEVRYREYVKEWRVYRARVRACAIMNCKCGDGVMVRALMHVRCSLACAAI